MERQNPGMVRFMDRLNEKMELLDEKIQNKAAKAGEDYLSFLSHTRKRRTRSITCTNVSGT